jgi:RNA polymerase sigma-70 factor (ECF subfamily)
VTARVGPLDQAGPVAGTARREAFEAAIGPLQEPLVRRLVLVLGSHADAQDVAQDAMLRAFDAWDRFDGRDPRAWLYTIALRLAFDQLRSRRRRLARLAGGRVDEAYVDAVDPDLHAALGRLEPRVRAALLANVVDGYAHREIAAMLGVPEGTVASWISRARARLREDLAEHG